MAVGSEGEFCAIGSRQGGVTFLGPDGRQLWRMQEIPDIRDISLAGNARAVLVASGDNAIHYLDRRGREIWNRTTSHAATSVGVSNRADLVVVGTRRGNLSAYDRTGKLLWEHQPGGTDFRINDIVISANGHYVVVGTDYMHIYLYDAKGNVLWATETTGKVLEACVSNNGDYIGYMTDDQRIYFAVKNSRVIWEYHFNRQPFWIDMASTADFLVVGESLRKVSVFTKSGRRAWSFELPDGSPVGRMARSGGHVLVGSRQGGATMLGIEAFLGKLLRQSQRQVERARGEGLDTSEADQLLYAAKRALADGSHQEFLETVGKANAAAQEAPLARKQEKASVTGVGGDSNACGSCGTGNPSGFQFCGGCGQKLAFSCAGCGTPAQPGFKFCGNCGHTL
jgi:hypothetical protein|tara:strand:- start:18 stop:1205 length:1188 start_codon:yes stop_codon:yes gene_type:complete